MKTNDKVIFRTCGRGVTRVWKGTITWVVAAGKLPPKPVQSQVPHGNQPSNRPRFLVALEKTGKLVWANATGPNIVLAGKRLPEHEPRLKTTPKKAKGKVKVTKSVTKSVTKPAKPEKRTVNEALNAAITKRSGGDKPKTTWYGTVDGKVVSVRKVICPEGFSTTKPALPEAAPTPAPVTEKEDFLKTIPTTPAVPAAEAALPQASV